MVTCVASAASLPTSDPLCPLCCQVFRLVGDRTACTLAPRHVSPARCMRANGRPESLYDTFLTKATNPTGPKLRGLRRPRPSAPRAGAGYAARGRIIKPLSLSLASSPTAALLLSMLSYCCFRLLLCTAGDSAARPPPAGRRRDRLSCAPSLPRPHRNTPGGGGYTTARAPPPVVRNEGGKKLRCCYRSTAASIVPEDLEVLNTIPQTRFFCCNEESSKRLRQWAQFLS